MVKQFEVSIANTFEAESIHDAVEQFAEWIANSGGVSGFRVTTEEDRTYLVDGLGGGAVYQVAGPPDGESG